MERTEQTRVQSSPTRLRPSTRLLRDVPAFQPWMLSRYGLALPVTSCDADLYATIYEQSKDGAGAFSESMTAFAATHGFSTHTAIAARRRLQAAGLIDYVLDDNGNRVSLTRPGRPVYLYRANLEAAFEAESRFQACMPENLAALNAVLAYAEDKSVLPEDANRPQALLSPETACPTEVPPTPTEITAPPALSTTFSAGANSSLSPAPVDSPASSSEASADNDADRLMWLFTSCYPKAQRGLDGNTAEKVKYGLSELVTRLGATGDEIQEACLLRRREARANNPELFDGTTTEMQKWKFLPSALDFVSRPQGLAADIMSVRMANRESRQEVPTCAASSNNVAIVDDIADNIVRETRDTEVDPAPSRSLCERVLSESSYGRAAGFDDLWFATCAHGINGGYQSWQITARSRTEAVADHRRQVESALGLFGPSDAIAEYIEKNRAEAEDHVVEAEAFAVGEELAPSLEQECVDDEHPRTSQPSDAIPRRDSPQDAWAMMVSDLTAMRPALAAALAGTQAISDDGSHFLVGLPEKREFYLHVLTREGNLSDIVQSLATLVGPREVRFQVQQSSEE